MMIDSTVLIDYLRGNDTAKAYLESISGFTKVSRVIVMEIIVGSKNRREMKKNLKFIQNLGLEVIEIDKEISQLAGRLFESYFHQFGLGITDALIAATAIVSGQKLATHNHRHFRFIKELELTKPY